MTSTGRSGTARQSIATRSPCAIPLALAVVLLAFGLRLWGLTGTSLWYDETFMLHHARHGVVGAVQGLLAEDNALPLYGLLLALWTRVAGFSEFTARALSVFLGTLGVPLVLQLGRAVTQRRTTGLGAALACATLPIFVYYSQEVRMYALAVPLAAAFLWAGWQLVAGRSVRTAYVVLGLLMLAAHPYTALTWLVSAVWGTLTVGLNRDRRRRRGWWEANLLLTALATPIGLWALWRVRVDTTAVSAIPVAALRWLPALYGVGQYLEQPWSGLFVAMTALSLIVTLIRAAQEAVGGDRSQRGLWQSLTWFLISLTLPIVALFGLTLIKAKWSERYLLPSWGLALAVAVGTAWEYLAGAPHKATGKAPCGRARLARAAALLLILGWLALATVAIGRQAKGTWSLAIRDEWHPRPDFRGVAQAIETYDAPGDSIVVVGGYATSALDFYYQGEADLFGLPTGSQILDTSRSLSMDDLHTLEGKVPPASRRLWLVLWQDALADPTGVVQSVLVEQCRRLSVEQGFTNVGLLLFDISGCRPLDQLAKPDIALRVAFQAPIALQGYRILANGETWEVDLWWEAIGKLEADYGVFVHLVAPAPGSAASGAIIAQHDHIAGADTYPTSTWRKGAIIRDRFFLTVPGGRCKDCRLQVGLVTPEGRLLRTDGADVTVIPVPSELQ